MSFRFEALRVWPLALEYVDACFILADKLPQRVQFSLGEQLRRAAVSIVANIAEGSGKSTRRSEQNFYDIARGSVAETMGILALAHRRAYVSDDHYQRMSNRGNLISSMLLGLIRADRDKEHLSEGAEPYNAFDHDLTPILASSYPDENTSPSPGHLPPPPRSFVASSPRHVDSAPPRHLATPPPPDAPPPRPFVASSPRHVDSAPPRHPATPPPPDDPPPWRTLSSQEAFRNRWLTVVIDQVELPTGQTYEYTRLEPAGIGVGILGFDDQGRVLLEREYRHGVGQVIWQLPGGLAAADEDLLAAGLRELAEETGHAPPTVDETTVRYLGAVWDNPAFGPMISHVYAVQGLAPVGDTHHDQGEFVACHWVTWPWLVDAVARGEIRDRVVIAAVAWILTQSGYEANRRRS